jgi:hypothetical protein
MSHNYKVNHLHLNAEEVKELALDEGAKPIRKQDNPVFPTEDTPKSLAHKKIKGIKKKK